jgi:hypothetical protein
MSKKDPRKETGNLLGKKGLPFDLKGGLLGDLGGIGEGLELGQVPTGPGRLGMIKSLMAKSEDKRGKLEMLAAMPESPENSMADIIKPSDAETQRVGELINAFFGEFGTAMRSYAFAKHGDDLTPDIEKFMENKNPDVETDELHKLGWESFKQLTQELSMPVMHLQNARKKAGEDLESADIKDAMALRIRDNQILPVLRRYVDAHGLFDLNASEDERIEDIKSQVPGYAIIVAAMMHDQETRGMHYALNKKVHGEKLDDKEIKLLADHADIVETAESMLASAGMGYATAPCNQVYGASARATTAWTEYMKEVRLANAEQENASPFIAKTHMEQAMKHHKAALEEFQAVVEGLTPVCDLINTLVDSSGTRVAIEDYTVDKVSSLVGGIPELPSEQRIKFDFERVKSAVERVHKQERGSFDTVGEYALRAARVNQYAETASADTKKLVEQVGVLKAAFKESADGKISITDMRYRDVFMGARALADRLEMMTMAAEQLHNDMGRITGKTNPEWKAKETEGERAQFTPPANPSEKIKRVAEELQRLSTAQHEVASKHRADLLAVLEGLGEGMDRFDIILDFFSRLKDRVGEQVQAMEERQAKWDVAHPGAGAAKAV